MLSRSVLWATPTGQRSFFFFFLAPAFHHAVVFLLIILGVVTAGWVAILFL